MKDLQTTELARTSFGNVGTSLYCCRSVKIDHANCLFPNFERCKWSVQNNLLLRSPICFNQSFVGSRKSAKSLVEVKIFKSWLILGTIIRKRENLSSCGKIPVIIILRQRVLFWTVRQYHKMLFAISVGLPLLILLVPQWMMTYLRWLGTGKRSTRQRICWVRSPPMPRFSDSLKKVSQTLL